MSALTLEQKGMERELRDMLLNCLTTYARTAKLPITGMEADEQMQRIVDANRKARALIALWDNAPIIDAHLASNRRSIYSLAKEPGLITAPAPAEWDAKLWTNLNTPEDLRQLD